MNLKAELKQMSLLDLKGVCRELGMSCPNTKRDIIKRLLDPLKKKYKKNSEYQYYRGEKLFKYTNPDNFGRIFKDFDNEKKIEPCKDKIIKELVKGKNNAKKIMSKKRKPYGHIRGLSPIRDALNPDNITVIRRDSEKYKRLKRHTDLVDEKGGELKIPEKIPFQRNLYLTHEEYNDPFLSKGLNTIRRYFKKNGPPVQGKPIYNHSYIKFDKKYNMNSNNKRKEIDLLHSKIQNSIKHIQKISNQYRKNPKILLRCNTIDRTLKELDNVLIFKNNFGISGDYKRHIKEKIRVLNEYLQNAIDNENQDTRICNDLCSMSYKNFWKRYNSQVKMTISNKYLKEIKVILEEIEVILSSNYRSLNDLIQSLENIIQELKEIVINIKHEKESILQFLNNDIDNKLIKYRLTVRESSNRKNVDEYIDFNVLNQ